MSCLTSNYCGISPDLRAELPAIREFGSIQERSGLPLARVSSKWVFEVSDFRRLSEIDYRIPNSVCTIVLDMTLNLMLTSTDAVYLSADFRLISVSDGTALPDNFDAHKLISVICLDWAALIVYAGIAS